jgi:hypothetical protein
MAKPLIIPEWATFPITPVATPFDPGLPYRQGGWVPGEKPPANVMNWYQNNVGQWCLYLDGFEGEPHVWAAANEFTTDLRLPPQGNLKHPVYKKSFDVGVPNTNTGSKAITSANYSRLMFSDGDYLTKVRVLIQDAVGTSYQFAVYKNGVLIPDATSNTSPGTGAVGYIESALPFSESCDASDILVVVTSRLVGASGGTLFHGDYWVSRD